MRLVSILLFVAALAACSGADREAQQRAQAQATAEAAAAKDASAYQQLVAAQSWELAQSIGREVVRKYPSSTAAAEVKKTLPDVDAKANALIEQRRLAALWTYQSGSQSGGEQHSASMYSDEASGAQPVRLILRRHADWGQSVYLHGGTQGFTCGTPCTVVTGFDDEKPVKLSASIPEGGEPAIFIEDDREFLERMEKAQRVRFAVTRKGGGPETVTFEVGGFEPSRWKTLSK